MPPLKGQDGNGSGIVPPTTYGVWGDSVSGDGIVGTSNSGVGIPDQLVPPGCGVRGVTGKGSGAAPPYAGIGVWGDAEAASGVCGTSQKAEGVYATTQSSTHAAVAGTNVSKGNGVYGEAQSQAADAAGVYGKCALGYGVRGTADFGGYGVSGECSFGIGVQALSNKIAIYADGGTDTGIIATGGVMGVEARAGDLGIGLYAMALPSVNSYAGVFDGPVHVNGVLTSGVGGFLIDHPTDAANQYLSHSFVESSERKNVYDGVVVLNAKGEATVKLPKWFEALNRDFRYQLTPVGAPGPDLHIGQKISKGSFKIAGGRPKMEVSWQVTGVRKDKWANANVLSVEKRKPAKEKGFYLRPDLYGKSEEKGLMWARFPEQMKRMKQARTGSKPKAK